MRQACYRLNHYKRKPQEFSSRSPCARCSATCAASKYLQRDVGEACPEQLREMQFTLPAIDEDVYV